VQALAPWPTPNGCAPTKKPNMSEPPKDRAGVIAPPPLIYLGFVLVGLALEYL
jgi:hypothetical protein